MTLMEIIDGYKKEVEDKKYDKVVIRFLEYGNHGKVTIESNGQVSISGDLDTVDLERGFSLVREKIKHLNQAELVDSAISKDFESQKIMNVALDDSVENWTVLKVLSYASDSFLEDEVHVAIDKERLAIVKNGIVNQFFAKENLPRVVNKISIRIVKSVAYINIINKKDL